MDTLQNQRRAMPTLSCPLINSLSQSLNMECLLAVTWNVAVQCRWRPRRHKTRRTQARHLSFLQLRSNLWQPL